MLNFERIAAEGYDRTMSLMGLMQTGPLVVQGLLEHAARWHGNTEIVSRSADGRITRKTYAEILRDAVRLSNALKAAGVVAGDRVATLAMNGWEHVVVSYAVPGMGAVFHTLNPRLAEDQLEWIAKDAEDKILLADGAFAVLAKQLSERVLSIQRVIYFSQPAVDHPGAALLSDFIADFSDAPGWTHTDETAAAGLCYTSGTTGDPKGVLYGHRSNVLHTLIALQPDIFGLSASDVILPIVPMYHANGWGLSFAAPAVGAKLVMPGPQLDGATLCSLMEREKVTFAAGVPTVWLSILEHMIKENIKLPNLRLAVVGGAALSPRLMTMFDEVGINVMHAWGMTELSPVGGACSPLPAVKKMSAEERMRLRMKQGRVPYGIDMRIVDEAGNPLPHDGVAMGNLQMRGPAVVRRYYRKDQDAVCSQGFFDTGDIATIDALGYVQIVDRAKDIIKSGGEWISSVELENAALSYPGAAMAAVVGEPHPKWDERPVLFVVPRAGESIGIDALKTHLQGKVAKWWVPERIEIVDALPMGATGKIDKKVLRAQVHGEASGQQGSARAGAR
jgi:fatty-acyl-CoA synthase